MPEIVDYIKNTVPEARMAGLSKNRQPGMKKTIDGEVCFLKKDLDFLLIEKLYFFEIF